MSTETATGDLPMQEIASKIESQLYPQSEEPETIADEEPLEDAAELPSDDTDSEDDEEEGSGIDEIAEFDDDQTIAALLGVEDDRIEVDDSGTVTLKAIVDGETKNVKLTELVSSYQLQSHVNNQSMAVANDRKEFDLVKVQVAEDLKTRVDGVEALRVSLEEQLVGEYNGIDWDRLRAEDPSEWSALRQEYAEKAQRIQQTQSLVSEESARLARESSELQQANMHKHLEAEANKMILANPTWTDETTRKSELDGMRSFLTDTYSFTDEDMTAVTDHRLISLIQDAKAYREGKKGAEVKKEKRVPKFRKPGATKATSSQMAKARDVKSKRAKVKTSGSISDVANLLVDRM